LEHVASASRADADGRRAPSPGKHAWASLPRRLKRPGPYRGGWNGRRLRRTLGVLALCAAVATGILIAVAPESGSSDFLARATAALTPKPGAVLYERWEHIITPEPGNRSYPHGATVGPEQLWIEDDSPHRYRAVLEPDTHLPASLGPAERGLAVTYGVNVGYVGRGLNLATGQNEVLNRLQQGLAGSLELGGATYQKMPGEVPPTLTFLSPNELLSARLEVTLGPSLPGPHEQIIENGTDPVSALRAAISEGRAHEAGSAQLDGRTVQRIDLDLPHHRPADAPPLPANAPVIHAEAYAYVEPKTFHPLEIVYGLDTYRFLAYAYLPATPANLALTNIQAQHPNATIVKGDAVTGRSAG
jgi:hypothetical protein